MQAFEKQIDAYAATLASFVLKNGLPTEWFNSPDHIAIKCADRGDFDVVVRNVHEYASMGKISAIDIHNRTLATAHLAEPVNVGAFGSVGWLEIMQPRPEKVGKGPVGIEHAEFFYPDFVAVRKVLNDKKIDFTEPEDNPDHNCIVIPINTAGQELKFNDNPLRVIVPKQLEEDRAYWL